MALEQKPPFVDTKVVAAAATPEALTDRELEVDSVYIQEAVGNTGDLFLCDSGDNSKRILIGSAGITIPITDPRNITIAVETNGEGATWVAV